MKLLVVYRRESDSGRSVEEFIHDFERLHPGAKIEARSLDTREGAEAARLYDVTNPPAIIATKDDGAPLNTWQGEQLPLMNEVASYLQM
jgi:hypothetical protein